MNSTMFDSLPTAHFQCLHGVNSTMFDSLPTVFACSDLQLQGEISFVAFITLVTLCDLVQN